MENQTESFKPLTISAENLPASMARQEKLTSYAADRAALLLGCYRTGDANDPETYVAAITAVLARYPEEVITTVTHPATGLPHKKGWLPTIKEVTDACVEAYEPIVQNQLRVKRIKEQMEAREREFNGVKPTMEQLKSRFGENYGLTPLENNKSADDKADENRVAFDRARERVCREYQDLGLQPPSKLALSPTALREIAEREAMKKELRGDAA